jgi:hypothetical protein
MTAITADVVSSTGPSTEETVTKTDILRFVRAAPRAAKRAVIYGGKTAAQGVRVAGRGLKAVLPGLGYLVLVACAVGVIVGAAYLNLLFIQFAFTVSPAIGYLVVLMTAVQLVSILIGSVYAVAGKLLGRAAA